MVSGSLARAARTLAATVMLAAACSNRAAEDRGQAAVQPPDASSSASAACGASGQPDCPLQAWMKANMSPALSAGDAQRLRRAFARAGELAPPDYSSWRALAAEGADALTQGDIEGARRACKHCHDEHRARYRAEMRARAL